MLYIDGEFVDQEMAHEGQIEQAVAAAARAFGEFSRWPAHQRADLLDRIAGGLRAQHDALTERIRREAKKPVKFARGEVDRAIMTFTFAAGEARRLGGETIAIDAAPGGDRRLGITQRVPRGPVAAITPFNFPLNLSAHKIAPAIACGATVVHKPAPETPHTAIDLARIVHDAGAPKGLLNVVPCAVETAAALVDDPRLPVLSFTGSATVGWRLRARAAHKQVLLELGGDAAVIIESDADIEAALPRLVAGAFAYAGQVCISVQHVYIHESRYDEFEKAFVEATTKLAIVGATESDETMVGPLIRSGDADRVMEWIAEAEQKGATVLCGNKRDGDTITPTVLSNLSNDCKLACEEIFGPVVAVHAVKNLADAIRKTNSSRYGLQAGIYTNDTSKLMQAFRDLQVGAVIHNDVPMFRVDHMPYGGTKHSGSGREGVRYAIEDFTEPRLLIMRSA